MSMENCCHLLVAYLLLLLILFHVVYFIACKYKLNYKGTWRAQTSANAMSFFPLCSPGGSTIFGDLLYLANGKE